MNTSTNDYLQNLKSHRRNLHQIPELGRELPKTKQYLLSVLEHLDCRLTFLCDTGICAFFDKGQNETFAFRADMDALPITERTNCSFASRHEGKMHACAHDGHMSMVLSLGQYVNDADDIKHNVLLIFQPAEETLGGAEEICKSGILKKYNVTRIFGFHIWPFTEPGVIASRPGAFMPRSSEINIIIHGKSAHGTSPYKGIDALYIAADLMRKIYMTHAAVPGSIHHFPDGMGDIPPSIATAPDRRTLIQFGKIVSGTARNIVADNADILGTVRAYSDEDFNSLIALIKTCIEESEQEYSCNIKFTNSEGYPPVVNNPQLYSEILPILKELSSSEQLPSSGRPAYIEFSEPLMISEDFSFYGHYAPAVYFTLGTGTGIPLHSNNFDFDERILLNGFNMYKELLTR